MTVLVTLRHRPESDRSDYRSANPGFILVSIGRLSPYFITHSVVAWQLANLWYFRYAIFPYEVSLSGKPDDDGHMGHAHCLPKQIYYVAATDARLCSAASRTGSCGENGKAAASTILAAVFPVFAENEPSSLLLLFQRRAPFLGRRTAALRMRLRELRAGVSTTPEEWAGAHSWGDAQPRSG